MQPMSLQDLGRNSHRVVHFSSSAFLEVDAREPNLTSRQQESFRVPDQTARRVHTVTQDGGHGKVLKSFSVTSPV